MLKDECYKEVFKARKKLNETDDTFNGDGGLYNSFTCETAMRSKAATTCAMNCVAQRVSMVN